MNESSSFDMQLKALNEKATGRLVTADVFDEVAFANLYAYVCAMAEKLKSEHVVSKQFLASILNASGAIRSRANMSRKPEKN